MNKKNINESVESRVCFEQLGKRNRHRTPLRKIKILGRTGLKELRIFWKEARTK